MPLKTFSNTVNVSYYKLKYWKYKLDAGKQELSSSKAVNKKKLTGRSKKTQEFIPLAVPSPRHVDFKDIELCFPNNVTLKCSTEIDLETLKILIKLF